MGDLLELIAKYGVMPVLVVVMAIYLDRREKKHEQRVRELEGVIREERESCAKERELWAEERRERERDEKLTIEKVNGQVMELARNTIVAVSAAQQMAAAFENEKREVREAREREIRDTGKHQPVFPPPRNR